MNYTRLKKFSLFYDYYLYIDHETYMIKEVEDEIQIPLRVFSWKARKENDTSHFCLGIIKARKMYREPICDILFPQMHRALWSKYGELYLNKCNEFEEDGVFDL